MKKLLEHLEKELNSALNQLSGASMRQNRKLEYIYRDLLNKTEQALDELSGSDQFDFESHADGDDIADVWNSYRKQAESSAENLADNLRDAFQSTETFSEFAQNFKNLTGKEISEQWDIAQSILGENDQNKTHQGGTFSGDAKERGVETIDMVRTLDQEIDEFSINIEASPQVETEVKENE